MTQNVLSVVLTLGVIGNLILIAVFSQHNHLRISCSYYLLSAAVLSIVGSNWAVVPLIWSAYHLDPLVNSLALCRIRGYIIHICAMSFRTLIVLALIWISIENNRCFVYGLYGFIYSIYQLICFRLVPSILMAIFGTLTLKNISALRRCIHPVRINEVNLPRKIIQKRDRVMALLVLIEIIVSFVCTLPYSIDSLYSVLTKQKYRTTIN